MSCNVLPMIRATSILTLLAISLAGAAQNTKETAYPSFDYEAARVHESQPHRRTIPLKRMDESSYLDQLNEQLHLTLIISPAGEVIRVEANGGDRGMRYWPEVRPEVSAWKFQPFEKDGKAVTASVEEYVDLVPPERLPKTHVKPPEIHPNSNIVIRLDRSGCYGACPSYSVTITQSGVTFEGGGFVVARGRHTAKTDPAEVRDLARRFVDANFYSMNSEYAASVTDCPTYTVSLSIDGRAKKIGDYMGGWVGMPAVVSELEDAVDTFARTDRWIKGGDGLADSLKEEKFNFRSYDAQVMLKEAAKRGDQNSVRDLLDAGVPLQPYPAPPVKEKYEVPPFQNVGWLQAASSSPETLKVLIDAAASEKDQSDKNLALLNAARKGSLQSVRLLIEYGANPDADFSKDYITEGNDFMGVTFQGGASVIVAAAQSGKPDVIREILGYKPDINSRGLGGKTVLIALAQNFGEEGVLAECIRLLVQAGADVNARDNHGNTALHETYNSEIEEELLKLGADINARNKDGETPIFTTVDDSAMALYIEHGADLSIRNNKGQTVLEAAQDRGPLRQEALRKAIEAHNQKRATN